MIEDSRGSRAGEDAGILDKIAVTEETLRSWPVIKEHPCRSCGNRCGCGGSPERCSLCPPCSEEEGRIRAEILMEKEGIFPDLNLDDPCSDDPLPGDGEDDPPPGDGEDELPDDDELEEGRP